MNLIDKAKAIVRIIKHKPHRPARRKGGGFRLWPSWRDTAPEWHMNDIDVESYIRYGFKRNSLVYSAIMFKVVSKMSAPLRGFSGNPDNPDPLPEDHALSKLLARPNPYQSGIEFNALSDVYFNLLGNAFIMFVRPISGGIPTAMYSLRSDRVTIIPKEMGIKGYWYMPEGSTWKEGFPILPADMMHVKLPNPDDKLAGLGKGMPPTAIEQSVDVDNDVTRYLKKFFQNGAMQIGLLKFENALDDEDISQIKERWQSIYGGVDNWSDTMVLGEGGSFERIGATFDEMGFGEIDERNETRIVSPFGVPLILIGTRLGLDRSTLANYDKALRNYWDNRAIPELNLWESNWQYYLTSDDTFVKYDLSKIPALQRDIPALTNAAHKMWTMGVPANQAFRAVKLLDIGNVPGGDIAYIPSNVFPAAISTAPEANTTGAVDAETDNRKAIKMRTKQLDEDLEELQDQYQTDLDFLIEQAMGRDIDQDQFEEEFNSLVDETIAAALLLGIMLNSDDLLPSELIPIDAEIELSLESVSNFADDLYSGRYDEEPEAATNRVLLWVGRLGSMFAIGQSLRRDDPLLMWEIDPKKKHCSDCLRLNRQIHRASAWDRSGWHPQGSNLECKGFLCGCSFREMPEGTTPEGSFKLPVRVLHKNGNGRVYA